MIRTLIAASVFALSLNVYANEPAHGDAAATAGEASAAAPHEEKKPMSKEECKAKGLKGKKLKECLAGK